MIIFQTCIIDPFDHGMCPNIDRCHLSNTRIPKHVLVKISHVTSKQLLFPFPKLEQVPIKKHVFHQLHPTKCAIISLCFLSKGQVVVPVICNTYATTWSGSVAVSHGSWRRKVRHRLVFGKPWRTVGEGRGVPPGGVYLLKMIFLFPRWKKC